MSLVKPAVVGPSKSDVFFAWIGANIRFVLILAIFWAVVLGVAWAAGFSISIIGGFFGTLIVLTAATWTIFALKTLLFK